MQPSTGCCLHEHCHQDESDARQKQVAIAPATAELNGLDQDKDDQRYKLDVDEHIQFQVAPWLGHEKDEESREADDDARWDHVFAYLWPT